MHPGPSAETPNIRRAELIAALSHALDLTEGQPKGHGLRVCWIGMRLGEAMKLNHDAMADLYYTLLLKDLGCSSNAARICELYLTDDQSFKADFKLIDGSLSQALRFVLTHTGLKSGMATRIKAIVNIMQNGGEISRELIEARCHRGAAIARTMGFSDSVAAAIENLDEHWDGQGKPEGRSGAAIPLASQISLLAQVADVFHTSSGRKAAIDEIAARKDTWFDPGLVEVFLSVAMDDSLWEGLAADDLLARILLLEPQLVFRLADEDYLDAVAKGFAMVIDAKSPYTAGHSARVAWFAGLIAEEMGLPPSRCRWIRRAGLLHDIGKLAISNMILDKPDKLTSEEFEIIKSHAGHSADILSNVAAFADMAEVAGHHHEKLDGTGYPKGLKGDAISLETRIITTADVFEALTADRPYRTPMPVMQALSIMAKQTGTAFDPACLSALTRALAAATLTKAA